jgi:small GTP-binding protein
MTLARKWIAPPPFSPQLPLFRIRSIVHVYFRALSQMIGLDGAGKTTILNMLEAGEVSPPVAGPVPTIGVNIEQLELTYLGTRCTIRAWDVSTRRLWRRHCSGTQGVVFVVDSTARDRMDTAREELHESLSEEALAGVPLLVFATKLDMPEALHPKDVALALRLADIVGRSVEVQGCAGLTGEGLFEGFDWLVSTMKKKTS